MTEEDYILTGGHMIYYVCEIEGETKHIGFDGGNAIVYSEVLSREEYKRFRNGEKELTEYQEKILDFPEKKMSFFLSQLPSYTHLQNLYKQEFEKEGVLE